MRSHAKASTAGSTQRQAAGLGRILRGAFATRGFSHTSGGSGAPKSRRLLPLALFATILATLALIVAPASATKSHPFKETFGSAAQPTLTTAHDIAIDQSTGDVLVMDAGSPPAIKRYNADGTPDNFSALGANVIDGSGAGDETPQNGLDFSSASESQIAIDNSGTATDGNIYVTQSSPNAINIFASTGAYLGQLTAAGATDFSEACGVAVDSTGALYVGDYSSGIKKFVPAANPPVNSDHTATFTTTSTPCTLAAGAGATAGFLFPAQYNGPIAKIDSGTGELKYTVSSDSHTTVAVDPATGHVYGATDSTVKELDASGVGGATSVSVTNLANSAQGLDVRGSSGDIFVSRSGNTKVEVFGSALVSFPDVVTTAATGNTGTKATLNGTVNPDGVELSECFFEYGKGFPVTYTQTVPCAETPAAIGSGTSPVAVHADISDLQPNGTQYNFRLVAKNSTTAAVNGSNLSFTTPDTVITTGPSGLTPTAATLNGTVNPDGLAITECLFEWGTTTVYGETAPCVPNAAGIGSGTSPVAVSTDLNGLDVGTIYHYRLKAANANGPILGQDQTLQTVGPVIKATWSEDVVITDAILKAEVDPEGKATTFHFEYGTTPAYGSETPELPVGSDSSLHEVSAFLEDLQQDTTYHYRVVATNADSANAGPNRTLTTFEPFAAETGCANQALRLGASAALPDCRAYEMVSPVDKNNGDIAVSGETLSGEPATLNRSSTSGNRFVYGSYRAFGDSDSSSYTSQYIATRGPDGWSSHAITPPRRGLIISPARSTTTEFKAFSPDLCESWLTTVADPTLAPDAIEGYVNLYRRQDDECGGKAYEALSPVQPPVTSPFNYGIELHGVSADGSHAIYIANDKLTPDAPEIGEGERLYEMVGGQLRYVCILPNGQPSQTACMAGQPAGGIFFSGNRWTRVENAISADGSRIFWTNLNFGAGSIYVRIDGSGTIAVSKQAEEEEGAVSSQYWTAARDGSKAIFTTGNPDALYEFDVDSETTHRIAGAFRGFLGASEDASRIYFVSAEVLSPGAEQGANNLYLYESDEGGQYTFVATISPEDTNLSSFNLPIAAKPSEHRSRVTGDGLHASFVSFAQLTGYDSTDLASGKTAAQVFLYDATANGGAGKLICVSCNPSGARPTGSTKDGGRSYAARIKGFINNLYTDNILSADGARLFFESGDALTPRDTNGRIDVYQWEAEGTGGCDSGDSSFAPDSGGCVSLITSGKSSEDSEFVDASPSGDDVFVNTLSTLVSQDYGLRDVYDARVGGGFPQPIPTPECVGDACQSIPAAPNDPTPASTGFRGAGDPPPRGSCATATKQAAKRKRQAEQARRKGRSQRAMRLGKQARRMSKSARRCRHAERGAGR